MDLIAIASAIASDQTSASSYLSEFITDDIKKQYDIDPSKKPFELGQRSAIFENISGNIVAFMWGSASCDEAYNAVGRNLSTLPEVFNIDTFEIRRAVSMKICVIEMEKLSVLSPGEEDDYFGFIVDSADFNKQGNIKSNMQAIMHKIHRLFEQDLDSEIPKIIKDIVDLVYRMRSERTEHDDLHIQNVGYGKDGRLKLLDWESIFLD